jgi:nucleoside-diphosphate-sugar epimerase
MNCRTVLVTGAAGFVGRHVVRALLDAHFRVKAGVHHERDLQSLARLGDVEPVTVDVLDAESIRQAMEGTEHVYHCAALLDARAPRERLLEVNAGGTRRVWECAAASGVRKALYCSSTAVYGLLSRRDKGITEQVRARAIEPYGYSKLRGEEAALDVAARTGLHTTIIRPVAIFGPGERTKFGTLFRDAALSGLLSAGGFRDKSFNFVHVEDVAAALVHLAERDLPGGEVYNVAVEEPIPFEEALRTYRRVLRTAGRPYAKARWFAGMSALLHRHPSALKGISALVGDRYMFRIWHPGFDLTYSPAKLLSTSFRFKWEEFEWVFASCL